MSSPPCVARVVLRLGLSTAAALSVLGFAVLLVLSVAAICLRPEAFAAGLDRVLYGIAAFVGTVAAATVPLLSLGVAALTSRRLSERGDAMALASSGVGPLAAWRLLSPLWIFLVLLTLLLAFVAEPPSWRVVHQLKGAPEAAAVAWSRLQAGEVRVLPGGGAVVVRDDELRFASGDGLWSGSFSAATALAAEGDWGWNLGSAELRYGDGSAWRAQSLRLRPDPGWLSGFQAAPQSPWSKAPAELLAGLCSAGQSGAACERSALVLHRRLALAALVPAMAILGWLLMWRLSRPGRNRKPLEAGLPVLALALYALLKLGEKAVAAGMLSGLLGAWLPSLPFLLLAGWSVRQSRGVSR